MPTLDQMDTDILSRCHSATDHVGHVVISDMEDFVGKVLSVIASFDAPLPLSDEQKAAVERKKNATSYSTNYTRPSGASNYSGGSGYDNYWDY